MGDERKPNDYDSFTLLELVMKAKKEIGKKSVEQLEYEFVTNLALRLLLEVNSETLGLCDNNQSLMLFLVYKKMQTRLTNLQQTLQTVLNEQIKTLDVE